jgi:glycosyltransferase involved in cell wall biosynthesis
MRRHALRVAHITPAFHPARAYGGPTESAYQLSRHLARHGCDVRVLTTDADGRDHVLDVDTSRELEIEPGFRVRYCPRKMITSVSPGLVRHLGDVLRWSDVVHLNAVYNFTTFPTLLGSAALRRPVVWSARGALQRWRGAKRPLTKSAWEKICRAIAPPRLVLHLTSLEEREESAARIPGAEVVVIPNGVIVPPASPARAVKADGALRLLSLGRLDPIKGLDNLLHACAELRRAEPARPFTLTVAGAGDAAYTRSLTDLIAALSLGDAVKLLGPVHGDADKARLFAGADLFVAPSHRENFGIAIAEALAHGLPVIAGKGTPWRGLEEHGAGLWVDNDPVSLARAIARAGALPLAEMGERGRAWVEEAYSWDRVAAEMVAVYKRLLGDMKPTEREGAA